MLQCRTIFPGFETHAAVRVLRSDYSVDCDSGWHTAHVFVAALFVAVAALIPVVVLVNMLPASAVDRVCELLRLRPSTVEHRGREDSTRLVVSSELAVRAVDTHDEAAAGHDTADALLSQLFSLVDDEGTGHLDERGAKTFLQRTGCDVNHLDYTWSELKRSHSARVPKNALLAFVLDEEDLDADGCFEDKELEASVRKHVDELSQRGATMVHEVQEAELRKHVGELSGSVATATRLDAARSYGFFCIDRLWKAMRVHPSDEADGASSLDISHRVAKELRVSAGIAHEAVTRLDTARSYSFLTGGFNSRCSWWETMDMLRKLTIVAFGTLLADPAKQTFAVIQIATVWLCVQVQVQPYRFKEDNALKTVCDVVIVVVCACEIAVHWGSENAQTDADAQVKAFEHYFVAVLVFVVLFCIAVVFVKICRLRFQMDRTSHVARIVLECVDGAGHASSAEVVPEGLEEEYHAMREYRAVGVVTGREEAFLRAYFERVRESESKRQQRFESDGVPAWAFVSSPEFLHTGEAVMGYIEGVCAETPWQFKQAFDWATSGNSYPNDAAAWTEMGPFMGAWGTAMRVQDASRANEIVKYNIAPTFLGLDWYKNVRAPAHSASLACTCCHRRCHRCLPP